MDVLDAKNERFYYPPSRVPDASAMRPGARLRPRDHLFRAAHAHLLNHIWGDQGARHVARRIFGADDRVTALVLKAAVNPATLGTLH
jgi:hypothetical protein